MKKIIVISIINLTMAFSSYSQDLERPSITSGHGSMISNSGESVQFTIGQAYHSNTFTYKNLHFLTQGFEQPNIKDLRALLDSDVELMKMEIYPNPAIDYVFVALNLVDNNMVQASIINMWGMVIRSKEFNATQGQQKLQFPFGSLAPGVYTIKVVANHKVYLTKVLINGVGGSTLF